MTNKEKMLQMVLGDAKLQELYDYNESEYKDFRTALYSENIVVATVARIINDYSGSTDPSDRKKVYMAVFNYIHDNCIL